MKPVDMEYCPECGIRSSAGAKVLRGEKGTVAEIQNEMERLRSERDALKQQLADALEREAALAAYLDRLSRAISACMSNDDRKFVFSPDDYLELEHALDATFSESLTRRDLIKQAEALDKFRSEYELHCEVPDFILGDLEETANDLRQRAQELDE